MPPIQSLYHVYTLFHPDFHFIYCTEWKHFQRNSYKRMAAEEEIMKMRLLVDGDGTGKFLYYFPI